MLSFQSAVSCPFVGQLISLLTREHFFEKNRLKKQESDLPSCYKIPIFSFTVILSCLSIMGSGPFTRYEATEQNNTQQKTVYVTERAIVTISPTPFTTMLGR